MRGGIQTVCKGGEKHGGPSATQLHSVTRAEEEQVLRSIAAGICVSPSHNYSSTLGLLGSEDSQWRLRLSQGGGLFRPFSKGGRNPHVSLEES